MVGTVEPLMMTGLKGGIVMKNEAADGPTIGDGEWMKK